MGNNNNQNQSQIRINPDAKKFASMKSFAKFRKKNKDFYSSKEDAKEDYYMTLLDLLPKSIEFCVKYGHINRPEIQQTKKAIYEKLQEPKFVKVLKKEIKKDADIGNIKLLPIIIREILADANKENQRLSQEAAKTGATPEKYDMSDMIELSQMIAKKRIKKLKKKEIPESLAFDIISIIPCDEALKYSQGYRIHTFFDTLYETARNTGNVPFEAIMDVVASDDYRPAFIVFALLERKEKFTKLTDAQKSLYLEITTWCLNTMENVLSKDELMEVLRLYVTGRRRDDSQGKDGNRRYALNTLPEKDWERINKFISRIISDDTTGNVQKYLS